MILDSRQGDNDQAIVSQAVDERRFSAAAEGDAMDVSDRFTILDTLASNHHTETSFMRSAAPMRIP